jgi:hypothetical protein
LACKQKGNSVRGDAVRTRLLPGEDGQVRWHAYSRLTVRWPPTVNT